MQGSDGIGAELAENLIDALSRKQDELNEVARILHEDVGQVLTVVGLQLDVLRQDFSGDSPTINGRLTEIQELLDKALVDVRNISYRLNPTIVPRSGLRYALDTLIGRMRESSGGTIIRFLMDSHVHLPLPVAVALYEITEHALENALRHSRATLIEVVVQPMGSDVRLEIRDNGAGFAVEETLANPPGLGLLTIRHTAKKHRLNLTISSSPTAGTAIHAVHSNSSPWGEAPSVSHPTEGSDAHAV